MFCIKSSLVDKIVQDVFQETHVVVENYFAAILGDAVYLDVKLLGQRTKSPTEMLCVNDIAALFRVEQDLVTISTDTTLNFSEATFINSTYAQEFDYGTLSTRDRIKKSAARWLGLNHRFSELTTEFLFDQLVELMGQCGIVVARAGVTVNEAQLMMWSTSTGTANQLYFRAPITPDRLGRLRHVWEYATVLWAKLAKGNRYPMARHMYELAVDKIRRDVLVAGVFDYHESRKVAQTIDYRQYLFSDAKISVTRLGTVVVWDEEEPENFFPGTFIPRKFHQKRVPWALNPSLKYTRQFFGEKLIDFDLLRYLVLSMLCVSLSTAVVFTGYPESEPQQIPNLFRSWGRPSRLVNAMDTNVLWDPDTLDGGVATFAKFVDFTKPGHREVVKAINHITGRRLFMGSGNLGEPLGTMVDDPTFLLVSVTKTYYTRTPVSQVLHETASLITEMLQQVFAYPLLFHECLKSVNIRRCYYRDRFTVPTIDPFYASILASYRGIVKSQSEEGRPDLIQVDSDWFVSSTDDNGVYKKWIDDAGNPFTLSKMVAQTLGWIVEDYIGSTSLVLD